MGEATNQRDSFRLQRAQSYENNCSNQRFFLIGTECDSKQFSSIYPECRTCRDRCKVQKEGAVPNRSRLCSLVTDFKAKRLIIHTPITVMEKSIESLVVLLLAVWRLFTQPQTPGL
jgi:hypothetical protein